MKQYDVTRVRLLCAGCVCMYAFGILSRKEANGEVTSRPLPTACRSPACVHSPTKIKER